MSTVEAVVITPPRVRNAAEVEFAEGIARSYPLPDEAARLGVGYWPHWDHTPLKMRRDGVTGAWWVPLILTGGYLLTRCPACGRTRERIGERHAKGWRVRLHVWRLGRHVERCKVPR